MAKLLLKVTHGDLYSFFDSGELTEFLMGSKRCQLTVKASHVEPYHIKFTQVGDAWYAEDLSALSGVKIGHRSLGTKPYKLHEGDELKIYPPKAEGKKPSVVLSVIPDIKGRYDASKMTSINLSSKREFVLGRDEGCDIVVNNPLVEARHCRFIYSEDGVFVEDLKTISGTFVNNKKTRTARLSSYDRISVAGAAFIFYDNKLLSSKSASGIEIEAQRIVKEVALPKNRLKTVRLLDNVNMRINAGEFVAIVGGSGAGKSTLMDCLTGVRPATDGKILYDGNDYYENINSYRSVVGIVPQRDIMHDDLTLEQGLEYTARLRMRSAVTKQDIKERVKAAIADVKLTGKEHLKISRLSGGQKKRVSIAMELLADPKVIFLDEPTSGLSPDLDSELMELLKDLSSKGRTIVVITHSMDNIDKCSRVAFLGKGGRLCYFGEPGKMFSAFNVSSYSKLFALLSREEKAEYYAHKYRKMNGFEESAGESKKRTTGEAK